MNTTRALQKKMYKAVDCPCNALALHCCQFGCCLPSVPVTDFALFEQYDNADWMTRLVQVQPSITLRQLVLPGSHDAASYTIAALRPFSAVGRTQNVNVQEQLLRGSRYLDLRVGGGGGGSSNDDTSVQIYHGCLPGGSLEPVLQQVAQFLKAHPGEFVIMEVVAEFGRDFTPMQKRSCLEMIQRDLDSYIVKVNNKAKLLNEIPLIELVQSMKKQLLVLIHPRMYEGDGFTVTVKGDDDKNKSTLYNDEYVSSTYGFYNSHRWMRNRWFNTRDIDQLLESNLEEVQRYTNDRITLLNNQFVLTPGVGGPQDIIKLLIGSLSLRPVSFAVDLYQADRMDNFMRTHCQESWNMIMMDFVDLVPALMSFLIGLNFTTKRIELNKVEASSSSDKLDVTDKAQSFICQEQMLYLTNISSDLDLPFEEGTLTISFRLVDKDTKGSSAVDFETLEVEFDSATEVVIGEYAVGRGAIALDETDGVLP